VRRAWPARWWAVAEEVSDPACCEGRAGAGRCPLLPSSGAGLGARVARQQSPILPAGKGSFRQSGALVNQDIFGPESEKTLQAGSGTVVSATVLSSALSEGSLNGGGGCSSC
jgi:hypothetical protein